MYCTNSLIIHAADENPLDRGSPRVLYGMMYTGAIYLHIFFEIIRRRRSTVSYAAVRAHRARIMLTMPLKLALLRLVEVSYFLFPLPASRSRPNDNRKGRRKRDGENREMGWRSSDYSKIAVTILHETDIITALAENVSIAFAAPSITQTNALKLNTPVCDVTVYRNAVMLRQ